MKSKTKTTAIYPEYFSRNIIRCSQNYHQDSAHVGRSLSSKVGHYVDVYPARPLVAGFEAAFIGEVRPLKKNYWTERGSSISFL